MRRTRGLTDVSWPDLVPRRARWDISVPLSPTRLPFVVLQDGLCSVHAAQALSGDRRRLCDVKVKLTTWLAIGAGLLLSAHSIARWPVRRGEVITRGGVKQVWSSRGEGWDVTPRLCAKKISTDEGGLSQSPPFFLCRAVASGVPHTVSHCC